MSEQIKKAMVLSAGLGTRLSPITQQLPKPLVSVLNIPNILHVLYILKKAGIEKVIMNLHYLPEKMEMFFNTNRFMGLKFQFTRENPIQGTGGGVKNAEPFLKNSNFILANCDFVTDIDIKHYMTSHLSRRALASMLLIQDESKAHLYSQVGIGTESRLVSLPKLKTQIPQQVGIFTGIHILHSEVLSFLEAKPCGINDVLYPKLMREHPERVLGFIDSQAFWYDTGDIPALHQTSLLLLNRLTQRDPFILELLRSLEMPYEEVLPDIWVESGHQLPKDLKIQGPALIGKNSVFGKSCKVGPSVIIGENSVLEESVEVSDSVVLPGARVATRSKLSRIIQFENQSLSANAQV